MQTLKRFLVIVFTFVAIAGCSNEQPTANDIVKAISDGPGIPEGWDHISLSHESINGRHNMVLKGKNQSLETAVNKIKDRITKPVEYADGLDPSKTIPEFEVSVNDGTWIKLLDLTAQKFGCSLEETDDRCILTGLP